MTEVVLEKKASRLKEVEYYRIWEFGEEGCQSESEDEDPEHG
jgi:hypothetical protein